MTKPYLKKIADIENRETTEHTETYRYAKHDGSKHELEIQPAEAGNTRVFKMRLQNVGALLPASCNEFIEDAVRRDPIKRLIREKKPGWLPNLKGYVLRDGVVGSSKEKIIGVSVPDNFGVQGIAFQAGTVEGWRRSVGEATALSSTAITAICASFAAPLLNFMDMQPFSICFAGGTRSGKTTAILAAASVIGIGKPTHLTSWNLTTNQLEERLPLSNDSLFPIDDLQALPGNDKDRYRKIHDIAYQVAQGHAKGRHSSFQTKRLFDGTWRTILITSSEFTIADLAAKAGGERVGGTVTRFIDIPVLIGHGGRIFDRSPQAKSEAFRRAAFRKIYSGCKNNHGVPMRKYLKGLMKFAGKRDQYINKRITFFRKVLAAKSDVPKLEDLEHIFGLLYAAGMLARELDVINWPKRTILEAIRASHRAAIDIIPKNDDQIQSDGRKLLANYLDKLPSEQKWLKSKSKSIGYEIKNRPGSYVVLKDRIHDIFASQKQRKLVFDWLKEGAWIEFSSSSLSSSPRFKEQVVWPDGKRRRSYTIFRRASASKTSRHKEVQGEKLP